MYFEFNISDFNIHVYLIREVLVPIIKQPLIKFRTALRHFNSGILRLHNSKNRCVQFKDN